MGAALSYARRYALIALVGIAGEDDLDAPDLIPESSPVSKPPVEEKVNTNRKSYLPPKSKPVLNSASSALLRDQLITEIQGLNGHDELALWAHQRLSAKNTLTTEDAAVIEKAYLAILDAIPETVESELDSNPATHETAAPNSPSAMAFQSAVADQAVVPIRKSNRQRSKAHLRFVASQPCLVCQQSPCDAHHLKFAQPRSLGMKVSDEFTVPLCRRHHQELHRHGNEAAWWANGQLAPLEIAKELWEMTSSDHGSSTRYSRSATSLDEASK